jgi:exodeoxyribonuclease VII large subunit
VERVQDFQRVSEATWTSIAHVAALGLQRCSADVASLAEGIRHRVVAAVDRSDERLAERSRRAHRGAVVGVERAELRVRAAEVALRRSPTRLESATTRLDHIAHQVRLLDPAATMARGWSITRTAAGRTVRSAVDLQLGDEIITTFANGTARSRVEETRP